VPARTIPELFFGMRDEKRGGQPQGGLLAQRGLTIPCWDRPGRRGGIVLRDEKPLIEPGPHVSDFIRQLAPDLWARPLRVRHLNDHKVVTLHGCLQGCFKGGAEGASEQENPDPSLYFAGLTAQLRSSVWIRELRKASCRCTTWRTSGSSLGAKGLEAGG
jgi:hypothetical protein